MSRQGVRQEVPGVVEAAVGPRQPGEAVARGAATLGALRAARAVRVVLEGDQVEAAEVEVCERSLWHQKSNGTMME